MPEWPDGGRFWIKKIPGNFRARGRRGRSARLRLECGRGLGMCGIPQTGHGRGAIIRTSLPGRTAKKMDKNERNSLKREVESHMRRIERIQQALNDSEENLRQVVDAPEELVREVSTLRMELRGRKAALAVGLSILGIFEEKAAG
jgi:hypothetical protein